MRKKISRTLAICLAVLSVASLAGAEQETARMALGAPEIVYDGTYLRILVPISPKVEDTALIDGSSMDPALWADSLGMIEEAQAAASNLLGVHAQGTLRSGGKAVPDANVYMDVQDGVTISKGFIYTLAPDSPREDLTFDLTVNLVEEIEGPMVEQAKESFAIPDPIAAETASFDTDFVLSDVLTIYQDTTLPESELAPDTSRIDGVFVSSSEEALCILLRYDGNAEFDMALLDAETAASQEPQFMLGNSNWGGTGPRWAVHVFDPVDGLPETITISLSQFINGSDRVTLLVDLSEEEISVL